jgi:transposase
MELVQMSNKELERYALIQRVVGKAVSQRFAATQLALSVRQVRRLCVAYSTHGAQGLVSKQRGKPSNRQTDGMRRSRIMALVQTHYRDFGPTLASEYLLSQHDQRLSSETLRQWMIDDGLWEPKRKRAKRAHPSRARRPCMGELIQIDGSPHAWFEDRAPKCTLIAFIDDATGHVLGARFYPTETTVAYLDVLECHVREHGRPVSLYSDRHGVFSHNKEPKDTLTQFGRACKQLGIESILALSPQAKGRVERLFQTLQDRLVKALRLQGISDMDSANAYLESQYIAQHNQRFGVKAHNPHDAHRAYGGTSVELQRICALHHTRRYSNTLACQFESQILQVLPKQPDMPKGQTQANIVVHLDGRLELLHNGQALAFTQFNGVERIQIPSADAKTLNVLVDQACTVAKRKSGPIARLAAQIAHQESLRSQGIYTPSHTSELPRAGYKRNANS